MYVGFNMMGYAGWVSGICVTEIWVSLVSLDFESETVSWSK